MIIKATGIPIELGATQHSTADMKREFELEHETMTFPFDTDKLIEICQKNDVAKIGVFGSMARGEASEQSDIDLVVYFSKPKSFLNLVRLEREMSEALGRKVDLLTEMAISPYLRESLLRELKVIYEA
ncbi:nucleotidyltransferase family protein [bacterium]|nr:nucleotidyltransferase family protein [bacterium]